MSLPVQQAITILQGASFAMEILIDDELTGEMQDLTGWTFRGQLRRMYSSAGSPTVAFTFVTDVDPTTGSVVASLTAIETAAIPVDAATGYNKKVTKYAFDIEAVRPDTSVLRIAEGVASVSPEVTR